MKMKQAADKPQKGARRLVIEDRVYWWFVGKRPCGAVIIWHPEGKKEIVQQHDLLGMSPDALERHYWKTPECGGVTPQDVVDYIKGPPLTPLEQLAAAGREA